MKFNPEKPYNNLPLLPPKNFEETPAILKKLIKAHRALAELKGYTQLLPNKNIILNAITLQEAKDSSEIENIITTHDELFKAIATNAKSINPHVKEVLNYKSALFKGLELVKEKGLITTNIILQIHEEIEHNNAGIRKLPGTTLKNEATGEVTYTPPDDEADIRRLLGNLEQFINAYENIDPLIKLAMIHYQFEAIHPFYDGNGRTGRILNILYLIKEGLIDEPNLYMSAYIIKNKSEYYRLLRQVTINSDWENWIMFILDAVEKTSEKTLEAEKNIIDLLKKTLEKIKRKLPKIYTSELVEILFMNVYTKIAHLVDAGIASRNIAAKYLKSLEDIGVLKSEKVGREVIYINVELFNLLKNIQL